MGINGRSDALVHLYLVVEDKFQSLMGINGRSDLMVPLVAPLLAPLVSVPNGECQISRSQQKVDKF